MKKLEIIILVAFLILTSIANCVFSFFILKTFVKTKKEISEKFIKPLKKMAKETEKQFKEAEKELKKI